MQIRKADYTRIKDKNHSICQWGDFPIILKETLISSN